MSRKDLFAKVCTQQIVGVVREDSTEAALAVADAYARNGIAIIEVTFTTPDAVQLSVTQPSGRMPILRPSFGRLGSSVGAAFQLPVLLTLMARVGLSAIAALNRINRGPLRIVTEIPVRILYVVIQLLFAALDRICFDPREVLSHLVVARKR